MREEREMKKKKKKKNLILTTTYILSFIRFSLFTLIPLLSHSFIQLLHIRSSTKISIHLRMDDAAQISRLFIHRNVLSRHQLGFFFFLLFFIDNDNDRILSSFVLFKQTTMKIQFDENEYASMCVYLYVYVNSLCVCTSSVRRDTNRQKNWVLCTIVFISFFFLLLMQSISK